MYACRDAIGHMTEAEEGALSGWAKVRYRVHTKICPHCRACLRQVAEARAIAREIPPDPVPPSVEEEAMRAFRARGKTM
jgi:predicted anti-sigma-YlaC factor YlaD